MARGPARRGRRRRPRAPATWSRRRARTTSPDPAPTGRSGADRRLRIDLAYDGSGFAGWARQPGQRTVQGVLEAALATVLRLPVAPGVTCAGRTDAGVHARGQVVHVDVPAGTGPEDLARRLAGVLPPDVVVASVAGVPATFDARFSALSRRYAYRVSDERYGVNPLRRHDTVWHGRPLDVARMGAAAGALLGEHDFAAYCRRRPGASSVRTLVRLTWARDFEGVAVATVEADAFCQAMVRALVGALLAVGDGRRPVHWPRHVLAARERDPGVVVAPARGLTLVAVGYPAPDAYGARAAQARARRASR